MRTLAAALALALPTLALAADPADKPKPPTQRELIERAYKEGRQYGPTIEFRIGQAFEVQERFPAATAMIFTADLKARLAKDKKAHADDGDTTAVNLEPGTTIKLAKIGPDADRSSIGFTDWTAEQRLEWQAARWGLADVYECHVVAPGEATPRTVFVLGQHFVVKDGYLVRR
jgi:hypothetical protein